MYYYYIEKQHIIITHYYLPLWHRIIQIMYKDKSLKMQTVKCSRNRKTYGITDLAF